MKLPTDIVTRYKIRDSKIMSLYARENISMQDIGSRFKISATRVHQIIYKNRHLIKIDKDYEKAKRIHHLQRILKTKGDLTISKDAVDILKELRAEVEGKETGSVHGGETKIIIIRPSDNTVQNGRVENHAQTVSRSISI